MRLSAIQISSAFLMTALTTHPGQVTIQSNYQSNLQSSPMVSLTLACPKDAKCSETCISKATNLISEGSRVVDIGECCVTDATLYVIKDIDQTAVAVQKLDPSLALPACGDIYLSIFGAWDTGWFFGGRKWPPTKLAIKSNLTEGATVTVDLTCPLGSCAGGCDQKWYTLSPGSEVHDDLGRCCMTGANLHIGDQTIKLNSPAKFPYCGAMQMSLDSTGPNKWTFIGSQAE